MTLRFTLIVVLVSLLGGGCSSFHADWRRAVAVPLPNDLSGPWEGEWVSSANGHRGKLRCLVAPKEEEAGLYDFHYWATWSLFRGDFATVYPVTQTAPKVWSFVGDSDLGAMGGVYHHEGEATPISFHADYTSSLGDRGKMTMTRPE